MHARVAFVGDWRLIWRDADVPRDTQPLLATELKHGLDMAPSSEGRQASSSHRLFDGTPSPCEVPWQVLCSGIWSGNMSFRVVSFLRVETLRNSQSQERMCDSYAKRHLT